MSEGLSSPPLPPTGAGCLPVAAAAVASDWKLDLGPPFPLARHSFVAPAGPETVLKLTPVGDDESSHEPEALALWAGDGAVRLLQHDPERRAMLLERAVPGSDISCLDAPRAIATAVSVGLRLWRPAGEPFRWIGDQVGGWLEAAPPATAPAARELRATALHLCRPAWMGHSTLVHGDLHHHNILDAGGGRYVAIDPKPMLGEPEFDVPPFLWNPIGSRISRSSAEQRLAAFAAAGLDQERMRRWAVIRGAYLGVGAVTARVLLGLLGSTGTGRRRAPASGQAHRPG